MTLTQSSPITILLDRNAHNYAHQFASQQATPEKGKQVYLNTLAVYAVETYLKCFPIKTNLAQSDCWNPTLRAMFNVADLVLPNLGKLECLGILPQQEIINIPIESIDNRLGYIVVKFEEELQQVELLGFISGKAINHNKETININQLQSLDTLFDTLDALQKQVNLDQWFNGFFALDWQPLETIMAGRTTRSITSNNAVNSITRGKAITWQVNNIETQVILVVKIIAEATETTDICLQLYPAGNNNNLPINLSVKVLDQANETCLSATTKEEDDWIQLEFGCHQGENFKIELNLAGIIITENFSI
ncbi:MAG: DUF1822 family protein [Xenococcaceae cyanobacterium MO_188.B19]|nr:DUF1822 family protein [Xenococcaceae cyanobacterium MO_188.B19]